LYEELRTYKKQQGDTAFFDLILQNYKKFTEPRTKECIEIILGAILRDERDVKKDAPVSIPKSSIPVFAQMSLMSAKRTLDYVIRRPNIIQHIK